ncbi:potassium channel family protein [Natronorubrum sp. DTA28]|uniref:potassium channel family protein n=1 Tax=Natronorubrum sp. DTA28 TaxID=3447019 RepID=UPI003F82B017
MSTSPKGDGSKRVDELRRRLGLGILGVVALILTYAVIYWWAMAAFEGSPVPFYKALQVVIESVTTAGFGGHAPWEAWQLNVFVLLMNLTGVIVVFVSIPLIVVPLLREALDTTPPTESSLRDHVVIAGHSPMDDVLRAELEETGIPYLFVESDPDEVTWLVEQGIDAIHGNAERVDTLRNANLEHATALVADLDDETNPTVILSADRVAPDVRIVSVVQNRDSEAHHRYAGADDIVVSKQSLGESLAMRAMETVSERFEKTVGNQPDFEIREYLVEGESELVGQTIAEADIFDRPEITIIGGWFGARFVVSPPPETEIQENSILVVSGGYDHLENHGVRRLPSHRRHPDRVVVCGYGDVGQATVRMLESEGIDVTVVDFREAEGVDVVGDATSRDVLRESDVENARSLVLALDSDPTSINAAIQAKQLAPSVEIIARANEPENRWKLYNAGADYVLSLPNVTGEILASRLVEDEAILTSHDEFSFTRTAAPAIEGQTLEEADIRTRTGCTIVGVERNGDIRTDVGADFQIGSGDTLIAVGADDAIESFHELVRRA